MLNRIIKFSLDNRISVLILAVILMVVGSVVTVNSEIDVFPDLNAPTVVVMTEAPGYDTEEIEKTIVYPIETEVNGATGVRRVRSSSSSGFAVVWVEFEWGTDIYLARQIVSEKLANVRDKLPKDVGSPTLGPQSSILGEILILGLTSESVPMMELRTLADKTIRPHLLGISGVSQVTVIGGEIKEYQIQISPVKMKHYNVSLNEVLSSVNSINNNVGAGTLYEYGNEYIVKGLINTKELYDIGLSVIKNTNGTPITINDIAEVRIGEKIPRLGLASEKLKEAVLITVTKQPNVDTNELTDKIEAEIMRMKETISSDINISSNIFRQSDFINNSISNIQSALIEGAIFVVIVLFFFLMNLRTTIVSLVALPLSVLISIIILNLMGYTLNTMSLGGLAIAIGSLVDDAIVDVENVYKRLKENDNKVNILKVVYMASAEVRMPIFNSSLIIIASFIPLFFLTGMEGRLLIPLGVSFIVALMASTIVALTVTPVLCSYLLVNKSDKQKKDSFIVTKLRIAYEKALNWSLGNKRTVLGAVLILFIVTLGLLFSLGRSFLPPFNEGSFTINVATLPGVSLDVSNEIGRKAEEIILSIPEIKTVARKTGRAELDEHSRGINASEFEAPYEIKDRSREEILSELRHKLSEIPGTNIEIGQPISHRIDAMLSGSKAQIAIKLFGSDLNKLYKIGSNIKNLVEDVPNVVDVNIEQQINRPELKIIPKRNMLAKYGITIDEFRSFVEVVLAGRVVSQVYEDGYPFDLRIISNHNEVNGIEKIKGLMIDSNIGKIPLEYVADVISSESPNTINRENVSRRIVISANVSNSDLTGAVNKIQERINQEIKLPEGYTISYGGQFESESEATKVLLITSLISLIVVFMLLYHEFKDVKESLLILINLPLAMIGGVLMLYISGSELNIPSIIGFISLLGISTRNGMLLISRYNHLAEENIPLLKRIYIGSSDRLNPIIMTALTTMLALVPLAVNGDAPGNEIQSPMAVVILGGIITATFLNIFVVPLLYYFINKNKN